MKRFLIFSLIIALTLGWAHGYTLPKCETENCQVCSSLGVCVMCNSNYMLAINKETRISQCVQNECGIQKCSRCLSENICAQCETGYVLHSSGSCAPAKEIINEDLKPLETCLRRSMTGKCLECIDSFNLEEGQCYFNKLALSSLATVACTTTIQNCATCLTPNYCTSCTAGLGLVPSADGSTCINNCNINGCLLCATSSTCGICQNGYTIQQSNTVCVQCALTGCSTCSANNVCQTCSRGYTLNTTSNTCYLSNCQYPCASCDYNSLCTSCMEPFSPNPFDNGTCYTCPIPNCKSCSANSLSVCVQCYPGYVPTAGNTICNWGTPSPLCSATNANGACTTCVAGYTLVNTVCTPCQNSPICMVCSSTNTAFCTKCQVGYYVSTTTNTCMACQYSNCAITACSSAGVCTAFVASTGLIMYTSTTLSAQTTFAYTCDVGCAQCATNYPTACLLCSPGYYIVYNTNTNNVPMCLPCAGNCQTCQSSNPSYCLSCFSNSTLVTSGTTSTCQVCDPNSNCLTCNPNYPSICTTCPFGYTLASFAGKVTTTNCQTPCPANCLTCFNAQGTGLSGLNPNNIACSSCEAGYSLSVSGACLPCQSNCRVCSGSYQSICLQCGYGFFLNSTYQCSPCGAFCQTCTPNACLTCISGYVLQVTNNKALCSPVCAFPCASCLYNQPTQCTQCIFGYTLSGTVCTLSSCVTNTTNACQNCPPGSVLNNGVCNACGSGCGRCAPSNLNLCIGCLSGYYLSGTSCVACPAQCQTCSSSTNCLTCSPGYATLTTPISVNQVLCSPCTPPCAQCTNNPEICTSCIANFTLSGWSCLSNFHYTFSASFSVGSQVFFNHYQALINRFTYALQTTNNKAVVVQLISTSPSISNINVMLTTIEESNSAKSAYEYDNLKFALLDQDGMLAGMPIISTALGFQGGDIYNTYSNVPTYCGIFIPLGIVIIMALIYFFCSRNDMDLPGSNYIPPPEAASERQATEMKTL